MIYDLSKSDLRLLKTNEQITAWLTGCYYSQVAMFPDLESIRRGTVLINEVDGYDWKVNINYKVLKRLWTEIVAAYPCKFAKFKFFNVSSTFLIVNSMFKQFLPEDARRVIELGCQYEDRLDTLYLVPTPEQARQRLLDRVNSCLIERYTNEAMFRL